MCPSQLQEIHVAVEKENEVQQQTVYRKKKPRGRCRTKQPLAVDLETQLIRCAEAVANSDRHKSSKLLEKIRLHSSPTVDATQRLAHYIAKALEARLAGKGSQVYRAVMTGCGGPAEIIKALQVYMSTCCFSKVAFQFSNRTICDVVLGKKKLHIVHYGIDHGFQWTELLQLLAGRVGGPLDVWVTNISNPHPSFRLAAQLEHTGRRLNQCASQLGVPFKFRAVAGNSEAVRAEDLHIDPDEVLVVNNMFHFKTLMDESIAASDVNPRDQVLSNIRMMKPYVFMHAAVNGSYSPASFVTRFQEALYNFMAHFDAIEATIRRDNGMRLLVERNIIAWFAMNIIASKGVERPQNYKEWHARNKRAGFRQLPLDVDLVGMLKDTVKEQFHKDFMINEDNRWLLQGWKGRVLYALSTWTVDEGSSSESA